MEITPRCWKHFNNLSVRKMSYTDAVSVITDMMEKSSEVVLKPQYRVNAAIAAEHIGRKFFKSKDIIFVMAVTEGGDPVVVTCYRANDLQWVAAPPPGAIVKAPAHTASLYLSTRKVGRPSMSGSIRYAQKSLLHSKGRNNPE
jgi:hypothetical protein